MRVLVTGGRDFRDQELLNNTLDRLHAENPITVLLHGGARGADRLAGEWAAVSGVQVDARPPDWKSYGRGAGVLRNAELLEERPDLVIAFPGGRGTADMVRRAKKAGIAVLPVEVEQG